MAMTPENCVYPVNFCTQDEITRQSSIRYYQRAIDTADFLGCPKVQISTGFGYFDAPREEAWNLCRDSLEKLAAYCERRKVTLLLEELKVTTTNVLITSSDLAKMIDEIGSDAIVGMVDLDQMTYAEALPLFGLRQNVFTDPQKPMKVETGIYPLNGADENSPCITTVDFALTYFLVSGELERSGVPVNLVISDAGGLSVLTAWAAGKLSGGTISKFFQENVESKVKSRKVIIPGKVAVLKGDIESKLPGWEVVIAPNEAAQLVKFLKDMKENGEI